MLSSFKGKPDYVLKVTEVQFQVRIETLHIGAYIFYLLRYVLIYFLTTFNFCYFLLTVQVFINMLQAMNKSLPILFNSITPRPSFCAHCLKCVE